MDMITQRQEELNKQFLKAVELGGLYNVKKALKEGADIEAAGENMMRALHLAAQNDDPEMILFLREKRANPNAPGPERQRPLHIAFKNKCSAAVEALITPIKGRKSANMRLRDSEGNIPVASALLAGNLAIVAEFNSQLGLLPVTDRTGTSIKPKKPREFLAFEGRISRPRISRER